MRTRPRIVCGAYHECAPRGRRCYGPGVHGFARTVLSCGFVASACASVQSTVEVTGTPGAPVRGPVPVYYGVSPDFPTQDIGAIDAYGQGARAHLDDLLEEAEARAQQLGADAIVVRDVRTVARYTPRTEMRPCTRYGMGRVPMQYTCPVMVMVLEVDMHLQAAAVRRGPARADVSAPWRAPAPAVPSAPWALPPPPPATFPEARAPARAPTLPDLNDVLTTPP